MSLGDQKVWYAAYGSNISRARFGLYIERARDNSFPAIDQPFHFGTSIRFAYDSTPKWGEGGVAFLDVAPTARPSAYGRLYRVTGDQFVDVFAMENQATGRDADARASAQVETIVRDLVGQAPPSDESAVTLRYWDILSEGKTHSGWYGRLLLLGWQAGLPILTFTSKEVDQLEFNAPSSSYLSTIARGLVETFLDPMLRVDSQLNVDALAEHIERATEGSWPRIRAWELVSASKLSFLQEIESRGGTILPTVDRRSVRGDFVVQPSRELMRQRGWRRGKNVIVSGRLPGNGRTMQVLATLDQPASNPAPPGAVRMDQKLRVALGIKTGDVVALESTQRPRRGRGIADLLRRYITRHIAGEVPQLMRAGYARYEDMELPVCRIPGSSFALMGLEEGSLVWVESVGKSVCIRALASDDEMTTSHAEQKLVRRDADVWQAMVGRSESSASDVDLPTLWVDKEARDQLGISTNDPVYVYRDSGQVLSREAHLIAMPILLGAFLLPLQLESWNTEAKVLAVAVALVAALGLMALKVRRTVR